MPYTPTAWADAVTPVNAVNLNKIEAALDGQDDRIVTLEGRPVTPPVVNGQWLKGVGGVPVWTALAPADLPAMVGYGTTLPASPVDGQEYILVDSLTNPTYQWRFRYNASSTSPYKWEFVGGAPLRSWVAASEATTSTPYVDLATVGPSITAPRAGEYLHSFGCSANCTTAGSALQIATGLGTGGQITAPGANYGAAMVVNGPLATLTAAQVVKLQYGVTFGGTASFGGRWLELMPRRVS